MLRDERRNDVWNEIRQRDLGAFARQLSPAVFAEAAARAGVRLGSSALAKTQMVWLGIASAWHGGVSFATVLTTTLRLLEDQQQFAHTSIGRQQKNGRRRTRRSRKHDPRVNDPTQITEEAFVGARKRMPLSFWVALIVLLGENFDAEHGARHRFRGFRVLAMDGTRVDVPNWKRLRQHFGAAKNKSGTHQAQARLVMLQFPFTRLPYRYEATPVTEAEVSVAERLIAALQPNDLLLMDAGFWSYGLLQAIARRGAFFALRLRKGLVLQGRRKLERNGRDRIVAWTPKDTRRKWRTRGLPRSLELRLVEYRVPGYRPQIIATNVLDPARISRPDWTRLTTDCQEAGRKLLPGLFHRRWEIETSYHELKVDLGLDRHLRGRTPHCIQYEIAGYVVLYLLLRWLMVEAAVKHGLDPLRLSFVEARRQLDILRPTLITSQPSWVSRVLLPRLLDRIAEHFVTPRPGRHFPRNKRKTKTSTEKPKTSKVTT